MPHNDHDEPLLCFDDEGNVIATQTRGIVHQKPYKIWHAIVNIWILNSKGEILCTRRSAQVSSNPNKWQTYVGGHVRADSNFLDTAQRELAEEIGLHINANSLQLVEKGCREDNMHVYESYAVILNDDQSQFHFTDGEVHEIKWMNFDEYQQAKANNPDEWCNTMKPEQYKKICEVFGL